MDNLSELRWGLLMQEHRPAHKQADEGDCAYY